MSPIKVGIMGAGFAADFHAHAYRRLGHLDVELVAVAATSMESARAFCRRHHVPRAFDSAEALLACDEIDLVDLSVPNALHEPLAIAAANAGKHIICEKPLTGYFGGPDAASPVGHTPKSIMRREAIASAQRILDAVERNGIKCMVAENWLYSPPIVKAARLARASGGTIMEIRARECHSGSHARYAKDWAQAGGGAILRLASHPICAALWFKQQEGVQRDGAPIGVASVTAEMGDLSRVPSFLQEAPHHMVDDWHDVENWATVLLTFGDGTRAVIQASDIVLGGMEDTLDLLLSNCRIKCDLTHSGAVRAFAPTGDVFADEYIMEKVSTKAGWSYPSFDEEYLLGYPQEIEDFVQCVVSDREPRSTARLGLDVVRVIYAAYQSAEEGRRIDLA